MSVKRYNPKITLIGAIPCYEGMEECQDGYYYAYYDYTALEQRLAVAEQSLDGLQTYLSLLVDERDQLKAELEAARAKYHELIFQVGIVHPGETRHETALRYLRQAEDIKNTQCGMPAPGAGT